ncbi:MAG: hypothetical protein M1370_08425 [Bacteroidetes bacterium]|nr:hypothetical protein [Bacteroidota bacterium]MCL5025895.1 hypothetical protein [Chloroflexota bacterium]
MEGLENAARLILGMAIVSGIPVMLLFVLGYWLRGDRALTSGPLLQGLALEGVTIREDERDSAKERIRRTHCWELMQCSMAKRLNCPAYARSYLPCWLAIQMACGEMKHQCRNCALCNLRRAAA